MWFRISRSLYPDSHSFSFLAPSNRLWAAILSLIILLASCTSPELPGDAKETLLAYWAALPSQTGIEYQIIRAWQGTVPADEMITLAPEMEIWCVETRISAPDDQAINEEELIWIVVRQSEEDGWDAALLATMSSLWPYEACGRAR